jgi:hypothetical protein
MTPIFYGEVTVPSNLCKRDFLKRYVDSRFVTCTVRYQDFKKIMCLQVRSDDLQTVKEMFANLYQIFNCEDKDIYLTTLSQLYRVNPRRIID